MAHHAAHVSRMACVSARVRQRLLLERRLSKCVPSDVVQVAVLLPRNLAWFEARPRSGPELLQPARLLEVLLDVEQRCVAVR